MQDQQQIKILKAVGQARQEALATPGVERRLADLAVDAGVVGASDERADLAVELRQRQRWGRGGLAPDKVPGQLGQQLGVDRAEQALDLSATLRGPTGGVDDPEPQVHRHLVEVATGEVAAVVDIERVRDAADWPGGSALRQIAGAAQGRC